MIELASSPPSRDLFYRCLDCEVVSVILLPDASVECRACQSKKVDSFEPDNPAEVVNAFYVAFPEAYTDQLFYMLRSLDTPQKRMGKNFILDLARRQIEAQVKERKLGASAAQELREKLNSSILGEMERSAPKHHVSLGELFVRAANEELGGEFMKREHRALLPHLQRYSHAQIFSPPPTTILSKERLTEEADDFSAFVKELSEESDRGAALVGAALIDHKLKQLLQSHLISGNTRDELLRDGSGALGDLASRARVAYVLGLITKPEFQECKCIGEIRNRFAHRLHGLKFEQEDIASLCGKLKGFTVDGVSPRQQYINSVTALCMVLWYRPEHAADRRARPVQWPWRLTD
jgi:mannitol operon repressor